VDFAINSLLDSYLKSFLFCGIYVFKLAILIIFMLEFCPMCRGLLMQKEVEGKIIGLCKCGFKRTGGIIISGEENAIQCSLGGGVVSEDNSKTEGFIQVCEKCGYNKAEASQILSNESEITVYTCLKCGHRTRESSGTSKS
jgi:DNA-directed RNA polymerase subunit M/transcription elongation factor TFIIS